MTPCPVCGHPIDQSGTNQSRRRQTCSRTCGYTLMAAATRARNARIDSVAVDRLIHGEIVHSTRAERVQATATLTIRGRSIVWIAGQLHVPARSISRYRAELTQKKDAA